MRYATRLGRSCIAISIILLLSQLLGQILEFVGLLTKPVDLQMRSIAAGTAWALVAIACLLGTSLEGSVRNSDHFERPTARR